jgi:hypothetical protein
LYYNLIMPRGERGGLTPDDFLKAIGHELWERQVVGDTNPPKSRAKELTDAFVVVFNRWGIDRLAPIVGELIAEIEIDPAKRKPPTTIVARPHFPVE